jgi:hypothetical protein
MQGLRDYYKLTDDTDDVEQEIADLKAKLKRYKRMRTRVADRADAEEEAQFCPECDAEARGDGNSGNSEAVIGALAPVMFQLALNFGQQQQRRAYYRQPPNVVPAMPTNNGYPGTAPVLLPPTQATMNGSQMPAYYPAKVPGYMNTGSGSQNYGTIPGGMTNAFGCSDMNQANSALDYPPWLLNMLNSDGGVGAGGNNQIAPPNVLSANNNMNAPALAIPTTGAYWQNMVNFQQGIGLINTNLGGDAPPVLPAFPVNSSSAPALTLPTPNP